MKNILAGFALHRSWFILLFSVFAIPQTVHGQIFSIQRILYGSPLIDSVPRNQFPRGGGYTAIIQGAGLDMVTGFIAFNPNVTGTVSSKTATAVTVQISSTAVAQGSTASAPIPGVAFVLQTATGPIPSGAVTFDIVVGPPPQVTNYKVSNSIKWLAAGVSTTVTYSADVLDAGNIQYFQISGCGPCVEAFGTLTGNQFSTHVPFQAVVNAPNDFTYTNFPFQFLVVSGSGQYTDPVNPGTLTIPVVQMQLVDPITSTSSTTLLSGPAVTSDFSELADQSRGTVVNGVAADGVTQAVIRITGAPPNETFALSLAQDGVLAEIGSNNFQPAISGLQADASGNAFVLYRAPLDFARPGGN